MLIWLGLPRWTTTTFFILVVASRTIVPLSWWSLVLTVAPRALLKLIFVIIIHMTVIVSLIRFLILTVVLLP
ncbi:hypothetical protein B0O80DRAFT_438228 [Mortierella sp. GBAus27b]|nr:hypothetical protein B0O80DRAFT_438228 [Mortierella sp. GBAus27b]